MKKILIVFGTRPEAIKLLPLIKILKASNAILTEVCITGQHRAAVDSILSDESIIPNYDIDISRPNQDLFDITSNVLIKLKKLLEDVRPDLVIVHGDTSTAYATALACFYLNIRVAHIESGLRTDDMHSPFPEEFNRRSISLIATYHFAPTQAAYDRLISEGIPERYVYMSGNTIVDSVNSDLERGSNLILPPECENKKIITLTLHRRESRSSLPEILTAINDTMLDYEDFIIIFPVHPNPEIKTIAIKAVGESNRFKLIAPLSSCDFRHLLSSSFLAVTDSGGVQEEAAILGVPALVIRDKTERGELVDNGQAVLCGVSDSAVASALRSLLDDPNRLSQMRKKSSIYGDGNSSQFIANILRSIL